MPHRPLITIATLLAITGAVHAQQAIAPDEPAPPPPIAPLDEHQHPQAQRLGVPEELGAITQALRELLSAPYLSDEERAALRVEHGVWTADDLLDPDSAASAALDVGVYDHPDLRNPAAHPFLRAQAALMRGQPQSAINALHERTGQFPPSYWAVQAQAQEMLGRADQAIASLIELENTLASAKLQDADEIAFAVQGLMQLTRLRGPQKDAGAEYQHLARLLANARDAIDRTSWRVRLVEAQLLYAHNNFQDARAAAIEALRLHPRNAQAAALIANMAVDAFDFDTAQEIANEIDSIAAGGADNPPPTVHSASIRARVALRRKDPEGAEAALDPVLAQMPEQRDLLALNAAASAAGFRMTSTQRLLDAYDARSPGSPFALMRVADTLSEARQYEHAAEMYRRVIERAPHWGQPRLKLGLLLVQAGLDAQAKNTLEQALDLDPFDVRARNSLTLVTELATYATIESEHFIVRYKPDATDVVLAREMPAILERIHERVCANVPGGVDHEPDHKTLIELMPNHEWFAVRIGGMPSIHTMAASTGPVIAIEAPRQGPKSSVGWYDWPRVLQHEYTHTVNLSRTQNRVIHWMTEANAVFNEDAPRAASTWAMLANAYENNELFDLSEINTAFVRPKKPTDRSLAYAQGAWMFEYIVQRYGKEAPLRVFDASAAGRSAVDAFAQTLSVTPESFLTEFRAWAKQQLIDRGLRLPDGVPDVYELFDVDKNADAGAQLAKAPTLDQVQALLQQHPDHPQLVTLQTGFVLSAPGERLTPEQVRMLEHACRVNPTDDAPRKRLARHFLAAEDPGERLGAIEHLEHLDAREIHSPAFAAELALLYARTNEPQKAMAKALRAVAIAPFDADQRERAARVALIIGDNAQALHQLTALTILEPDREIHTRRLEALKDKLGD